VPAVPVDVERGRESVVVDTPELVGTGGEVWGDAGVEQGAEVGVLAVSEEKEEIVV